MALTYATARLVPTAPAIYARISADDERRGLGVQRQVKGCTELLDLKGWPTSTAVYCDNDISASRKQGRTKHRPEWQRLLADIESRKVDAVVAWDIDRLGRDPFELEAFYLACERSSVLYISTYSDEVDLARGDGLMIARIKAAVAAEEVRKTRERVVRKKIEIAEAGKPHGGPRAYGYERDGMTIVPAEAAMITEAVDRLLAGEAVSAICYDWNAAGRLTASGKPWRVHTLKDILRSPRIAGLRQHRGEVVGIATWPAILPRSTWEEVAAALTRRAVPGRKPGRQNLLSGGLLRCSLCGSSLSAAQISGARRYRCLPGPGLPGCGGVTIIAGPLDELITEAVLQRLASPKLAKLAAQRQQTGASEVVAEIEAVEGKLSELADMWDAGDITRAQFVKLTDRNERRLAVLRKQIADASDDRVLDAIITIDEPLREAWPNLSIDRRRAILSAVIEQITVSPAITRGRRTFDPERLDVRWRK